MISVSAYAKLNLALVVKGRREDGFHEIDSYVQTIELADVLTVRLVEEGVRVVSDLVGLVGRDLTEVAAEAILEAKGCEQGAEITVRKGIPCGAGLGGGSSDAAATLNAIDALTAPRLASAELMDLAAQIGSDVPLFLQGGSVRMRGRGDITESCKVSSGRHYVVLVPPIHCNTAEVYRQWDAMAEVETGN